MNTRPPHRLGVRIAAPVAVIAALILAGCSDPSGNLAGQYESSDPGQGYVSGDGRVVQPPASEREAPVAYSGTLDTGEKFDSASALGKVVILNFWYASCPPCREEAPDLVALHKQFAEDDVVMLGVNVSDTPDVSLGFAKKFKVDYPSIIDVDDNGVQLAFASSKLAPNSVPTTLVIDRTGRIAARFSGIIDSPSVVADIVDELLAEKD
ncbi:MAG: alkyl hydroperoxide reductase [Leifsonia xyli]|nr:MAG: alkyl hydroperoxide reductase [Leifsonia xyli]